MERLNKVIAKSGVCSRRKADEYILNGDVKVNGVITDKLGTFVKKQDEIKVLGKIISKEELVYYLLNKPKGVISSASDEKNRKTVCDIAKEQGIEERVYPVGRLDYDSAGLIILTNDGSFANKIMHPRYMIEKEYLVRIDRIISEYEIKKLNQDKKITLDGKVYNFKKIRKVEIKKSPLSMLLEIIISEGKNHEVKNIFKALNANVLNLTRIRIGNIKIDTIGRGYLRKLKIKEIKDLKNV